MILLFKPLVLSQEHYNEVLFCARVSSWAISFSRIKYFPTGLHPQYFTPRREQVYLLAMPVSGLVKNFKTASQKDSWQTIYDIYLVEEVSTNLRKDKKKANLYSPTVFPSSLKSQNHGSTISFYQKTSAGSSFYFLRNPKTAN